jgi:hypothetical protein
MSSTAVCVGRVQGAQCVDTSAQCNRSPSRSVRSRSQRDALVVFGTLCLLSHWLERGRHGRASDVSLRSVGDLSLTGSLQGKNGNKLVGIASFHAMLIEATVAKNRRSDTVYTTALKPHHSAQALLFGITIMYPNCKARQGRWSPMRSRGQTIQCLPA